MAVPTRIRIPQQAYPGFGRLVAMPPGQVEAIAAGLRLMPPMMSRQRIAEQLAPDLGVNVAELDDMLAIIFSLHRVRDEQILSVSELVDAICQALDETHIPELRAPAGDWALWKERLALLLDLDIRPRRGSEDSSLSSGEASDDEQALVQALLGSRATHPKREPLLISALNWSPDDVQEIRARLVAFEEDWEAPGMEAYDDL